MSDVLNSPRVQPIYWGGYYSPIVIRIIREFLVDLVSGTYMNGLSQYGIKRGQVLPHVTIPDPEPATLDDRTGDIQRVMQDWLKRNLIPRPAVNETSLIYLILPPTTTSLLVFNKPEDPTGLGLQGWHQCFKFNEGSSRPDTVYGVIKTSDSTQTTILTFLNTNTIGAKISHELVEAFNDPFVNGRTELGDGFGGNLYKYKGKWLVQQYLSIWDGGPINGEHPVSVKHFLSAIGANPAAGFAALGIKHWTVDLVADLIASH